MTTSSSPADIDFTSLPGRELDRDELVELVRAVAARPELWEEHVRYDDEHRHYVRLHRDAHAEVWLLCWTPSNDTGWHDHDVSAGAVVVVRGAVVEHNLAIGSDCLRTVVPAGHSYSFGPDHIHRMTGEAEGSVTIHAYSPPLWRMGQYAISSTSVLRRTSVSYADELRPTEEPFPPDQARLRDALL